MFFNIQTENQRKLMVCETKYYLSFQDGRVNNIDYSSYEEANEALEKINNNNDICIMSYVKRLGDFIFN